MNILPNGRVFTPPPHPKGGGGMEGGGTLGVGGGVNTRPFGSMFIGWLYEHTSLPTSNFGVSRWMLIEMVAAKPREKHNFPGNKSFH